MFHEERFEVVDQDRLSINVGIRAAGADTGRQDIPHGDPRLQHSFDALLVRNSMVEAQQFCEDRPEGISRMSVILPSCQ